MVSRGWFLQIPSFSGYAATMAYLLSRKHAIAISLTVDETADSRPQLFDRHLQGPRRGIRARSAAPIAGRNLHFAASRGDAA
jgi:hypothetical protein